MYESQVRLISGRELVAQVQPKQNDRSPRVDRNAIDSKFSILQSFLPKSRRAWTGALAFAAGCVLAVLPGCGVTGVRSGSALDSGANTPTADALSMISCGTQSLAGAQTKACSVYLSGTATKRIEVSLTSSNAALKVPSAVEVQAGANTAGFNATSEAVSQSVSVTIMGEEGGVTKTDVITLNPAAATSQGSTLSKVSCGTQSLTGAQTKDCSVYLSAAATSQTVVKLSSSSSALQSPTSVDVPAGNTTAGFAVTASAVSTPQTATLTATADGVSKTDAITLYPTGTPVPVSTLSKIACVTQTVTGPAADACSVYLSAATTSQTVVKLSSTSSALTVPASVTVVAGATSVAFTATASTVTTTETATLTATADGVSETDVIQLDGTGTQHDVQLSWNAPSSTSVQLAGYRVYRSTAGASSYQPLNSSVDVKTTYTDTSVQSGQTYDYVVKSVDTAGVESAPSNVTSVTIP